MKEKINYANPAFQDAAIASAYGPGNSAGLAALNVEVSSQAAMIGYTNDFRLMMILVLMVIPLLLLVQSPKSRAPAPIEHIAAE